MDKPVAHLIRSIDLGGAEKQLLQLTILQAKTRKVKVLYFSGTPTLLYDFKKHGIEVFKMPSGIISKIIYLNSVAREGNIIHTHLPHAELFASLFLRRKFSFLTTRHVAGNFSRRLPEFLGILLLNFILLRTKQIITISNVVKRDIVKKSVMKKMIQNKSTVIYYGFPSQEWSTLAKFDARDGRKEHCPIVIGTISRLEKQKNLDSLLLAFQRLNRKDLELKIIGQGTQEKKLNSLTKRLGLHAQVKFLGKTRKVMEFLDSIDIFILASKYEGFGIVLVEAASRGRPILASKLPICLEVLGLDGALFFDPNNISDMVATIQKGLEQFPMTRQISNAGAKIREYDLETLISRTDMVYENLY